MTNLEATLQIFPIGTKMFITVLSTRSKYILHPETNIEYFFKGSKETLKEKSLSNRVLV
jgi:hypothetical protein